MGRSHARKAIRAHESQAMGIAFMAPIRRPTIKTRATAMGIRASKARVPIGIM